MTSPLGIWPFDSDADKNLAADIAAAGSILKARAYDKLPLGYKVEAKAAGLFRDVWGDIIKDYMTVARQLGRPYLSNAEFYTAWEPRMEAFGYDKSALEILFQEIRGMNADGSMPADVGNPAHVAPKGDTGSPIAALGGAVESGLFKVGIFAVVALAAYGFFSGAGKGAAARVLK